MPADDKETLVEDDYSKVNSEEVANPFNSEHPTGGYYIGKWKLEGLNVVYLSVVVFSTAVTIALIICVFAGNPQVLPHGAVFSDDEYCSKAGVNMMKKKSGNAVDAAVAAAFCITVTRPDVASLGGCGALLVHNREIQSSTLYDSMCSTPAGWNSSYPPTTSKSESLVGVPGLLSGLYRMHSTYGSLSWLTVLQPAIRAASNGFKPNANLAKAVAAAVQANPPQGGRIALQLHDWITKPNNELFTPVSSLADTLTEVANTNIASLYGRLDHVPVLGEALVKQLNAGGAAWDITDLTSYVTRMPAPTKMGFADFTITTFPAPYSGGTYLSSLLGNLDMLNKDKPLRAKQLAEGDVAETSILMHRLIELSKFADAQSTWLGDPLDGNIANQAKSAEEKMLGGSHRQITVNKVNDRKTFEPSFYGGSANPFDYPKDIGDTFILSTDSTRFAVMITIVMGAPFGSAIEIAKSGVHLNAALRLFNDPASVNVSDHVLLNQPAAGRRPIVPVSPVYMATTKKKCGLRYGIGSSSGHYGLFDLAQVISNSALFLQNLTCQTTDLTKPYTGSTRPSPTEDSTANYSPAADLVCLPLKGAMDLKRFSTRLTPGNATNPSKFHLDFESGFSQPLVAALTQLGHHNGASSKIATSAGVGFTGYSLNTGADSTVLNHLAIY